LVIAGYQFVPKLAAGFIYVFGASCNCCIEIKIPATLEAKALQVVGAHL